MRATKLSLFVLSLLMLEIGGATAGECTNEATCVSGSWYVKWSGFRTRYSTTVAKIYKAIDAAGGQMDFIVKKLQKDELIPESNTLYQFAGELINIEGCSCHKACFNSMGQQLKWMAETEDAGRYTALERRATLNLDRADPCGCQGKDANAEENVTEGEAL